MTEERYSSLKPGPVTDPSKLPPPRFIDCIKVDKVYEECKIVDSKEFDANLDKLKPAIKETITIPEDFEATCISVNICG